MKIIAKQTRRVAHPKPYLPQVLFIAGHVYDTDELPEEVTRKVLERGFCEEYAGQSVSATETLGDNAELDTPEGSVDTPADDASASSDIAEDENAGDVAEDENVDDAVEDEETPEAEETPKAEEDEKPVAEKPQTAKKIIRRRT